MDRPVTPQGGQPGLSRSLSWCPKLRRPRPANWQVQLQAGGHDHASVPTPLISIPAALQIKRGGAILHWWTFCCKPARTSKSPHVRRICDTRSRYADPPPANRARTDCPAVFLNTTSPWQLQPACGAASVARAPLPVQFQPSIHGYGLMAIEASARGHAVAAVHSKASA
jgi:hypothetical protein